MSRAALSHSPSLVFRAIDFFDPVSDDPRHLGILFTNIFFSSYFSIHSTSYAREATAHSSALDNSSLFSARNIGGQWI